MQNRFPSSAFTRVFCDMERRTGPAPRSLCRAKGGYAFLVGVLAVGAIGAATTVSMLLLGLAAQQSGAAVVNSAQAWEYANTCMERALRLLRTDLAYVGEQTVTFAQGTCTISTIGGSGNERRTLCVEGESQDSTRKMEVTVKTVFPSTLIQDWKEVTSFTLCDV